MISDSVKIYIKDKGYLDVSSEYPLAITYSVADIRDTSGRGGTSSKTLALPGTKNNNLIFGELFEIKQTDFSFNLNTKYEIFVLKNGIKILDGYLTLKDIVKNPQNNLYTEDSDIIYNVVLYNKVVDFYTKIDSKKLEDIHFNIAPHTLTSKNIYSTSANTYLNTYKYFTLMKQGGVNYSELDMWPAIYAKQYFDRIINDAGYNYSTTESTFLVSDDFKKLVIPFAGTINPKDESYWEQERFFGRKSGDTVFSLSKLSPTFYSNVGFNDYSSYPYFLNSNSEPQTNEYQVNYGGGQKITLILKGKIKYSAATSCWYADYSGEKFVDVISNPPARNNNCQLIAYLNKNNYNTLSQAPYSNDLKFRTNDIVSLSEPDLVGGQVYENDFNVVVNFPEHVFAKLDNVKLNFFFNSFGNYDYKQTSGATNAFGFIYFPATAVTEDVKCFLTLEKAEWFNTPVGTTTRMVKDPVDINKYVPKNIKQKEYIGNIARMFNLYIDEDKKYTDRLVIKHRDDYYSTGVVKDWTDKVDNTKQIKVQYLPELQKKEVVLSYKKNDNEHSKKYSDFYNETYGQHRIIFESDTVIGEERKEIGFYECPSVDWYGLVVPAIDSKQPKNLSILFDNGLLDGSWVLGGSAYTKYMCASHFDSQTGATIDLNFGFNKAYFKEYPSYTQNNLFNLYHYNTFKQISEQKMVTRYMVLNESDIENLKLSDKIVIDGQKYIINKVNNYNPLAKDSTEVEFLAWDSVYEKSPGKKRPVWGGVVISGTTAIPFSPIVIGSRPPSVVINDTINNDIKDGVTNTLVIGRDNTVEVSDGNLIIGNNNKIWSDNNNITLLNSNRNIVGGDSTEPFTSTTANNITLINSSDLILTGSVQNLDNVVLVGATQNDVENLTSGNTFVIGSDVSFLIGETPINQYISSVVNNVGISGTSYILVSGNGTPTQNGTSLLNAYSEARGRVTGGTTSFCSVLLFPGLYQLTSQLYMDTSNVYLCGVGAREQNVISGNTIFVADNVYTYIGNITNNEDYGINMHVMHSGTIIENCKCNNYAFGAFSAGTLTASTLAGTFKNCESICYSFGFNVNATGNFIRCKSVSASFGYNSNASGNFYYCFSNGFSFGFGTTSIYFASGYFKNCYSYGSSFGYNSDASGTFVDCYAFEDSFGYQSNASGFFKNCVLKENNGFGVQGNASGTFINCSANKYSFGYQVSITSNASGTFINCIAFNGYSFGNYSDASGTFINCTSKLASFGYQGDASGYFKNCYSEGSSFGNSGEASGIFIDCVATLGSSFGYKNYCSGTFINCITSSNSFGSGLGAEATSTSYFLNCKGGGACFGSNVNPFDGVAEYCIGDTNSFGGTGRTGTVLFSRLTSGAFSSAATATGIVRYSLDGSNNPINLN